MLYNRYPNTSLVRRVTAIHNQIRTRCEATCLAQQEQHRPSELIRGRQPVQHGSTEPLLFKVRSNFKELVCHCGADVAGG